MKAPTQAPRWRPATEADARLIWQWRNDPQTRRNSLSQGKITLSTHKTWMAGKLADKRCALWIAQDKQGKPVGQARVDLLASGVGVVSIAVAPNRRGQGWGTAMLLALPTKVGARKAKTFRAVVKPENLASVIAFLKAGYLFKKLLADGSYELERGQ